MATYFTYYSASLASLFGRSNYLSEGGTTLRTRYY